ncbi:DNA-directed RNA polymerase subunit beta [Salinibacterium sp. dk2585]|uniref:DNA-directed RNA polymerase subunit beta n=1 Tax=unclassified Salinibacterium TaxID=2632331 RepID=UPI0011C24868|nr:MULTISPECIES: DNA-directed RNA polymerase subunit beta [unclassified Salinibacterium]QEE62230.1 DNA-directed RNA polymerase subunit beta [Salinibacterium sp. dk2585]TXK53582.1 DNA-directed RNA polymerase subunit beta [Salinibacterium sp. dk5596]
MAEDFHKPTLFAGSRFDDFIGGDDPAKVSRIAHDTAAALLSRVRDAPETEIIDRLVAYTDDHGIDAIAELWSRASPRSLPGALWAIYLLRALTRQDAEESSFLYRRGSEVAVTIDPVVAGATVPTGPEEITALADQILRGLFDGDFAVALDRAAAFCRLTSLGATNVADDLEVPSPDRASALTAKASRLSHMAAELVTCAKLWRAGSLD